MPNQVAERIDYINPDALSKNLAFTQAIAVSGPVKTLYIGMQNAVDGDGKVLEGDLVAQTALILSNIDHCLAAAGAERHHIIQMTISIVQGQRLQDGFAVFQSWWGRTPNPPTNNGVFVAGLAHPAFLIGVEAIAVIPAQP